MDHIQFVFLVGWLENRNLSNNNTHMGIISENEKKQQNYCNSNSSGAKNIIPVHFSKTYIKRDQEFFGLVVLSTIVHNLF